MSAYRLTRLPGAMWPAWMCGAAISLLSATSAVAEEEPLPPEWPQQITRPEGEFVIYQPQLETFDENHITARAAVSLKPSSSDEPTFGAIWFTARVATDREDRTVVLRQIDVTNAKFPHATPEQIDRISGIVEAEFGGSEITIALDRVLAMLDLVREQQSAAADLKHDPPDIVFVDHPALLVTLDGPPKLQPAGNAGVMRVVNTPFFIALDPGSAIYFMTDGMSWLSAPEVTGPWQAASGIPSAVRTAAATEFMAIGDRPFAPGSMPEVIVATEPTELIVADGEPQYSPIEGTELLSMSNTDSDVFMEIATQRYYVLLSGRWYSSGSLKGGWSWVPSDELAADFAKIPPGSERGNVLASIPGTQQATDAMNDAAIPQTAVIDRNKATLTVEYDGPPKFEPIEGTDMAYAVNTASDVIRLDGRYYCCDQGVWFEADEPKGPWTLCTDVPDEIETIPPSCPLYHVQYADVYDYDDDWVYVGYYPGYLGYYRWRGGLWYGTGWRYRSWYRRQYWPRPTTFGYGFRYDRYTGTWGARARNGGWIPPARHEGGWWGSGGYHREGFEHRRSVGRDRDARADRHNLYNRPANRNRTVNPQREERAAQRESQRQERARQHREGQAARADREREARERSQQRDNNVYADRNGNVYRHGGQGWEQRGRDGWSRTDHGGRDLDRQRHARQNGAQRTNNYHRARGNRGGGGRRR